MASQRISTNTFGVAKWVVSADATQGTHTTIAGAISSASSGDTVFIRDGTYTENLTLKPGVNLVGLRSNSSPIIVGNATLSTAGGVNFSGIELQTNSANLLTVSGSVASVVNLFDCYLNCSNNTGISYSSSSASSGINLFECNGDLGTTGISLYSSSGAGEISISYSNFTNSGGSTTASSNSAGNVFLEYSAFLSNFSTSGTGIVEGLFCNLNTSTINAVVLTTAGTGSGNILEHCEIASGTASCVSIGTGTTCAVYQTILNSANTNAITGAGTLNYSALTFSGTSKLINTTTQSGGVLQGGIAQAPSAGFIGEQIRSAVPEGTVTFSTANAKTVTSISLTPGIWDISAILTFGGTITGTQFLAMIGTTNNSISGLADGDNAVQTPTAPTVAAFVGLTVPSYRQTVTTTTTYYLIGFGNFTAGTLTGGGRISATRVG